MVIDGSVNGGFSWFVGPIGPIDFGNVTREMRDDGRRLEDFEIFRTASGGRRYVGIWRSGAGEEVMTGPMVANAFGARGLALADDGLSLVDVEVELFNGNLLYHGLFRTEVGAKTNRISEPKPIEAFHIERDAQQADGRFLADMETVEINGVMHYVGIWRVGDAGRSAITALRQFEEFRIFSFEQAEEGRFPSDVELHRIVPTGTTPPPPLPPNATTADLPGPPSWVTLEGPSGSRRVVMEFDSSLPDPGYRLTIHTNLLPILPRNADGETVFPDNICGLRVFEPSSNVWQTPGENPVTDPIDDGEHLSHPSYAQLPLETEGKSGLDFTGPMGACAGAYDPWVFHWPLTSNSTGGPPNRILTFESPTSVEFLNHNVQAVTLNPLGVSLKPKITSNHMC